MPDTLGAILKRMEQRRNRLLKQNGIAHPKASA
jgi:hypothetical protein